MSVSENTRKNFTAAAFGLLFFILDDEKLQTGTDSPLARCKASGHRTRAVFERYNIVSERDLKEAARKLDNYLTSQNGAKTGQTEEIKKSISEREHRVN